jgi:hypothetical protein
MTPETKAVLHGAEACATKSMNCAERADLGRAQEGAMRV